MVEASTSNFESREQALKEGGDTPEANFVKMWLSAIDAASKEEKDWREEGDEIVEIYRSAKDVESQTAFNILYSNTETLLPALYNSTPVPDIRRRYNDPGPVSKAVADILERSISYSVDMYDFDGTVRAALYDAALPGRGLVRVRYSPHIEGEADYGDEAEGPESSAMEDFEHSPEGEGEAPEAGERVTSHQVHCEYVPWKNFRRGPGLVWDDVDWVAFQHFLSREQLEQLDDTIGKKIPLDYNATGEKAERKEHENNLAPDIFGRALVWEVWDRVTKQVVFISPSWEEGPVRVADDPYKLTGFFPIPRPLVLIDTPSKMVPVPQYRAYRKLAEELNEVTARIRKITRQMRVKGMYAGAADNFQEIVDADDGDLIPVPGMEAFIGSGGLESALAWWPLEPATKALAQLYEQREAIKQTIYEVCGIADIMRGNTKANETLGAQQIKAQWGSLRVQRAQAEVARFCRDLFRMKAELIATFYPMETLVQMTGVQLISQNDKALLQQRVQAAAMQQATPSLPTSGAPSLPGAATGPAGGPGAAPPPGPPPIPEEIQKALEAPSMEEVEALLRNDVARSYKIDVESDSTIRADLTRNQESMSNFIQATAGYVSAVGPAVQAGVIPKELALEIFSSFTRFYKLGKQVEDALERTASTAREEAQNPPPPPPNPEMEKVKAQMALEDKKLQVDVQSKQADIQMQQQELQLKAQELELKKQEMEIKLQLEQVKAQQDMQIAQEKAEVDRQVAFTKANADIQVQSQKAELDARQQQEKHEYGLQEAQQKAALDSELKVRSHQTDEKLKAERAKADTQMADREAQDRMKDPKKYADAGVPRSVDR